MTKDYWFETIDGEKYLCFTKKKYGEKVTIRISMKELNKEAEK